MMGRISKADNRNPHRCERVDHSSSTARSNQLHESKTWYRAVTWMARPSDCVWNFRYCDLNFRRGSRSLVRTFTQQRWGHHCIAASCNA